MLTRQILFNPALARMRMGAQPIGLPGQAIDWEKFRTWDDYRHAVLLPVYGKAVGAYAGRLALNQIDVGLDAMFRFAFNAPVNYGPEERVDAAADIALGIARLMYEADAVQSALDRLRPRWRAWAGLR